MTHLGPNRSYRWPVTTMDAASIVVLTKTTAENWPRLQPNSAMTGFSNTPIMSRAPALTNRIANDAASTYQP